jgi:hypothetical protein
MSTELAPELHKKLLHVLTAVDAVEKRGKNEKQSYDYVKATDVAREVRGALAANGIGFSYSVESSERWEKQTHSGGMLFFVELKILATFTDTETGNSTTVKGLGWGMDSGDKAPYKAMTGALKYALRMNFLIPDELDPENDSWNHARPEVKRHSQPKPNGHTENMDAEPIFDENGDIISFGAEPIKKGPSIAVSGEAAISEGKAKRFWAVALSAGKSKEDINKYLFGIGLDDIRNCPWKGKTYENAVLWAEGK